MDGLDKDIKHLNHLFADRLNYSCYPQMTNHLKMKWTKKEFLKSLEVRAEEFHANLYDPVANEDGLKDGMMVGSFVGACVGSFDGLFVGSMVGSSVGSVVGSIVGSVGLNVGSVDGNSKCF